MNKNKFKTVKFCNEKQFNRAKNSYFFNDAECYNGKFGAKSVVEEPVEDSFAEEPDVENDEEDNEENEVSEDEPFNEDGIYEVELRKRKTEIY